MGNFKCSICEQEKTGRSFKSKDGKNICRECARLAVEGTNKTIIVKKYTVEEFKQLINHNQNKTYDLNTAKGMYDFSLKNGLCINTTENWAIKHFGQIYLSLLNGEKVEYPFICSNKENATIACAITDKRLIIAKSKLLGNYVETIDLTKINNVTIDEGSILSVITITMNNEKTYLKISKIYSKNIYNMINKKILGSETKHIEKVHQNEQDKFLEIREYKKLLDGGIITEEEFNRKKQELLGL